MRKKLLHIKSNQAKLGGDGQVLSPIEPKLPSAEQIDFGEIAVNYHEGVETLSIKNDKDGAPEIVVFSPTVQETGVSPHKVMSQKAVTDALNAISTGGKTFVNGTYVSETVFKDSDGNVIGTPSENVIYKDTDTSKMYIWNGSSFVETSNTPGAPIIADEDGKVPVDALPSPYEVFVGDTPPVEDSVKIFIDESVDPIEVEIYTQSQIDAKVTELANTDATLTTEINNKILVGNASASTSGNILIDTSESVDVEVYTKAQVNALFAKLYADNPSLIK